MKTASAIARYLAGVIFLVFGLNGFLNFIPLPPPGGIAGQFMGALYASHYLWVIFAFQLVAGVLLLVNRYVPLAVAMLAPVIVNILSFHALMAPSGLPLALFVAVLWAVIFVDVRPAFAGLFQARLQARACYRRKIGAVERGLSLMISGTCSSSVHVFGGADYVLNTY
jgi:putative oxidoreductase